MNSLPIAKMTLSRINSPFGWRTHPVYKTRSFHNGIDYPAAKGTRVYAYSGGKVAVSKMQGNGKGLGNYIVILHQDGTYTLYAHLSVRAKAAGNFVNAGEYIGQVGSTGDSTGPHLHFGMCRNYCASDVSQSDWFDPLPFLKAIVEGEDEMVTETKVLVDGKETTVKRILKDGENYIRLRDFDDILGIAEIGYDSTKKIPTIKRKAK